MLSYSVAPGKPSTYLLVCFLYLLLTTFFFFRPWDDIVSSLCFRSGALSVLGMPMIIIVQTFFSNLIAIEHIMSLF